MERYQHRGKIIGASRRGAVLAAGAMLLLALPAGVAVAEEADAAMSKMSLQAANSAERGDGSMGAAARRAFVRGPLAAGRADLAAKAGADRARARAESSAGAAAPADLGPAGKGQAGAKVPTIVGGLNFAGQFDAQVTPSDSTGAVGTTRYLQTVNRRFGIYTKAGGLLASGTLAQLTGLSANVFDPQVIWDPTTQRFYYTADAVFSASDNRLAFGFSTTASPSSAANFCKYFIWYGAEFPDYPKLGDNQGSVGIGVNVFGPAFLRSDVVTVNKPPAGSACPSAATFSVQQRAGLRDATGQLVFTPVVANQIDNGFTGFIVARNFSLPSNRLWLFRMSGGAVDAIGKSVTVPSYTVPPNASQAGLSQLLDTLDARNTQAVYARNAARGNAFSLWTQHTIANGAVAAIRVYEINPAPAAPPVLRADLIASASTHLYNAAVSPDRASLTGATGTFGGSYVVGYSVSGAASGINPRIVMGSRLNGGPLTFAVVQNAVGPYRDFSCPNPGNVCRWGDYAGATPDPRPTTTGAGEVWLTNQFAGSTSTSTAQANWRTRIWAARP